MESLLCSPSDAMSSCEGQLDDALRVSETLGQLFNLVVLVLLGVLITRSSETKSSRIRNRWVYLAVLGAITIPLIVLVIVWSPEWDDPLFIAIQVVVLAVWAVPFLRARRGRTK